MEPLYIESTLKTPEVKFDNKTGIFEVKGMSCAEYALDFYKPLFSWLDKYIEDPQSQTIVNIHFKYFNTSSAKCILQLFERIAQLESAGRQLEINWFYNKNDEQMLADGENYSEILGIDFVMKEVS
ncbi:MAG TPA: DUF1987 domain-containing protein [Cytophagales bacterium]|nr:DUF1987 domain-containing protein [Cytophagales bacterium]